MGNINDEEYNHLDNLLRRLVLDYVSNDEEFKSSIKARKAIIAEDYQGGKKVKVQLIGDKTILEVPFNKNISTIELKKGNTVSLWWYQGFSNMIVMKNQDWQDKGVTPDWEFSSQVFHNNSSSSTTGYSILFYDKFTRQTNYSVFLKFNKNTTMGGFAGGLFSEFSKIVSTIPQWEPSIAWGNNAYNYIEDKRDNSYFQYQEPISKDGTLLKDYADLNDFFVLVFGGTMTSQMGTISLKLFFRKHRQIKLIDETGEEKYKEVDFVEGMTWNDVIRENLNGLSLYVGDATKIEYIPINSNVVYNIEKRYDITLEKGTDRETTQTAKVIQTCYDEIDYDEDDMVYTYYIVKKEKEEENKEEQGQQEQ